MLFKKKQKSTERAGIIVADNPTSLVSEQFRTIRTNIKFSMVDQELQTLLVTSATPDSGKTTIASNLAAACAMDGAKVLLVATDMRKPRLTKIFQATNANGITTLLANRSLMLEDVVQKSDVKNLHYVICGPIPPNPAELLSSNRMTDIIDEMKAQYDLVIFDSPPLLAVADAQILAAKVDGTLLVVPKGEVTKAELKDASNRLKKVNANVIGTVMNKVEADSGMYYYYGED